MWYNSNLLRKEARMREDVVIILTLVIEGEMETGRVTIVTATQVYPELAQSEKDFAELLNAASE